MSQGDRPQSSDSTMRSHPISSEHPTTNDQLLETLPPAAAGSQPSDPRVLHQLPRSHPLTSSPTKDKDSYESSELSDLGDDESEAETDKMDFLDDDASAAQAGDKVSDLRRISHLTELAHLQGVDSDDSDDSDSLNNATSLRSDAADAHDDGDTTMFQSFRTDNSDTEEHDTLKRPRALVEADLMAESSKKLKGDSALRAAPTLPLQYPPTLEGLEPLELLDTRNGVSKTTEKKISDASLEFGVLEDENNGLDYGSELSPQSANGDSKEASEPKENEGSFNGKSNGTSNGVLVDVNTDNGAENLKNGSADGEIVTVSKPEDFAEPKLEEVEQAETEAPPEDDVDNVDDVDESVDKGKEEYHIKDEPLHELVVESPKNEGDKLASKGRNREGAEDDENNASGADDPEEEEEGEEDGAEGGGDGPLESADEGAADDGEAEEEDHDENGEEDAEGDEEIDLDLDEQRKLAIQELISIEKDFSFLRDKLYSDKLALLEHEMELCLDGSHPELLQIYYKVNEFYQQNIEISNLTLNYSLKCINTETMASRTGIHQDFMKKLTDMKNDMVAETTLLWYKINRERNYLDQLVPDYNYAAIPLLSADSVNLALVAGGSSLDYYDGAPVSKKVMTQNTIVELVQRRNELNEQLGVLNGLKEFHGIPCAVTSSLLDDDVCSVKELLLRKATPDEINEDLHAMGIF